MKTPEHQFTSEKKHKNHDKWAPYGVCKVKNHLIGDFLEVLCAKRSKLLANPTKR
jgi:hypothetical protein